MLARPRPSHYDMLGIKADADEATIKKAFRALSLQWHPDRQADWRATLTPEQKIYADEVSKRINEAHSVLTDTNKRITYDRDRKLVIPEDVYTKAANDTFCEQWLALKKHKMHWLIDQSPDEVEKLFNAETEITLLKTEIAELKAKTVPQSSPAATTPANVAPKPSLFSQASAQKTELSKIKPEGLSRIKIYGEKNGSTWICGAWWLIFREQRDYNKFIVQAKLKKIDCQTLCEKSADEYYVTITCFNTPQNLTVKDRGQIIFEKFRELVDLTGVRFECADFINNIRETFVEESSPSPAPKR